MIIAQWQIDARFGHKQEVLDSLRWWSEEIGSQIGLPPGQTQVMTGSIGANESTVISQMRLDSISDLDEAWNKLKTLDKHKKWSRELEPNIVSGSHRWEVYRVMD